MAEISHEQLEQAITMLSHAIEWYSPPKSDVISPARQMSNAQGALSIVVAAARAPRPLPETITELKVPEMAAANGDHADEAEA
jgi:hypothetical protein